MKIYISLPISGHDIRKVREIAEKAKERIKYMGHEPVSPLEVSTDESAPYSEHMGKDIAALLECDAVMFVGYWTDSKGCQLEYQAARIYGKWIMFSN